MSTSLRCCLVTTLCFASLATAAAPQPLENFARRPQMHGVTISANGQYIAFLSGSGDDTVLMTFDRHAGGAFKRVTASEPGKHDIGWCRWASDHRLLCGLHGNSRGKKYAEAPFKRLFAVNTDGTELKLLEEPRNEGSTFVTRTSARNVSLNAGAGPNESAKGVNGDSFGSRAQGSHLSSYHPARQDEIIDLTPDDDDTVMIELDDDRDSYRTILQLNIYNGIRSLRLGEFPPIEHFVTDSIGNPRLGWGTENLKTLYFARIAGERDWRKLAATEAFSTGNPLRPVAMTAAANTAYALGLHEGRDALWTIDLTDQRAPRLQFSHPLVDVGEPILRTDRRFLGMRYDVERPYAWYADPKLRELIDGLDAKYPNQVHDVVDSSADMRSLVIRASSDVDEATYYVYDTDKALMQKLGSAYPELDPKALGTMTYINYKASDGAEVPGYLTIPSGVERKNLPLIVMPHDGPTARDSWQFSFLRTFLANRGYAVLQMNYRGSAGFGEKWRLDAHQQWGELTHSDIQDATRWAVSEGIADPKRICIMGWGFGGYSALLSAARGAGTYRCAISIGGIADLASYQEQGVITGERELRRAQIGTNREKLQRESPVEHASSIGVPVLLIHGTKDWQVQMDQSKAMARALAKARKDVKLVLIKDGTHDLARKSERVVLLKEVEGFLVKNLAAEVTGAAPGARPR